MEWRHRAAGKNRKSSGVVLVGMYNINKSEIAENANAKLFNSHQRVVEFLNALRLSVDSKKSIYLR